MAANPFARHGIDNLSPSSLNLWAAAPALWVMERMLGRRSPIGAPAARGRAVEHGVHGGLIQPSLPLNECVTAAERAFNREMALNPDERREAEARNIAGYVAHGLDELRQYGLPSAYQEKVSVMLEAVPVPVIGYIDWRFDQHGLIVDLKTAERLPAVVGNSHGRQAALYARSHGNYGSRLAYVKPSQGKKDGRAVVVYELSADEVHRHLAGRTQIAVRLGRFLAISADAHELAGLLVPDYDRFYWNNAITRAHGAAVYGF